MLSSEAVQEGVKITYGDFELTVVEEEGSVGAAELIMFLLGEGLNVNTCHFPI